MLQEGERPAEKRLTVNPTVKGGVRPSKRRGERGNRREPTHARDELSAEAVDMHVDVAHR